MKTVRFYFMMWLLFSVLFAWTVFVLELLEGNKITTTLYMGWRNFGSGFILFAFLAGIALYPVTFFLLSLGLNKFIATLTVKALVYTVSGTFGGIGIFNIMYSFEKGSMITKYGLNMESSVILFSLAGLIYALLEHRIRDMELFNDSLVD